MKCLRYILIVEASEFLLEVSMGRLFEGRVNLAISVGDPPPANCIQSRNNAMRVIFIRVLDVPIACFIIYL